MNNKLITKEMVIPYVGLLFGEYFQWNEKDQQFQPVGCDWRTAMYELQVKVCKAIEQIGEEADYPDALWKR
jgi:hypothetical protein